MKCRLVYNTTHKFIPPTKRLKMTEINTTVKCRKGNIDLILVNYNNNKKECERVLLMSAIKLKAMELKMNFFKRRNSFLLTKNLPSANVF